MTTIKTAVSIEESLFNQADELAEELQVSRSRLVSLALSAFIEQYETQKIIDKLNEVYAGGPVQEDEEWLEAARQTYLEVIGDEQW